MGDKKQTIQISHTLYGYLTYIWYLPFIRLVKFINEDYGDQLVENLFSSFEADFKKYFKVRVITKPVD